MGWQGIIFDLNGVLLWDGALQERAWAEFSANLRGQPLSPAEMAVHVHGRNNRHTLEYLLSRPRAKGEPERLSGEKEAIYRRLCLAEAAGFSLSPGAASLLDWLAANGIPRAIATASGRGNVDFFRKYLGLDRWFRLEAIVYDDGTLRGKPAPDLYCRAAQVLGLPPAGCVVVEDSLPHFDRQVDVARNRVGCCPGGTRGAGCPGQTAGCLPCGRITWPLACQGVVRRIALGPAQMGRRP